MEKMFTFGLAVYSCALADGAFFFNKVGGDFKLGDVGEILELLAASVLALGVLD